ncbi:MAG: uracil-DNA glycosylase [Candidatus Thiodiazotropha sp. (ex Lucinoma aequizonata)]|nr:uracil-DNA glycosylase [Candidatus Thiodiazotropha sp. (ex Lucinoma aequizonata)]MCU7887260.1 uracil-DNA glycosylase [Candidatus Thiodiazotropha sp. (ex Lucinoma aequizonata)]MCU7896418.1 uracil-DNA glycosylase [Candidatus Thiodiazotropha sp. (ex Lucinoma aequizonata)]MCU7897551.1 uracil-DNA glycosylase [Candidatus Thiodiazotropha sp. (ex Lucinoma aequizonata)]MCU7901582.1 uracil-DNA glycosylase [Candidatus Thiodiazotropha sp. (ex Lucinoma aequizonata)]
MTFNPRCRRCLRLVDFLDQVKKDYPNYHAAPVAPFGDAKARLLIVGLAPGMHGANATGCPFAGDHAGILLYQTLFDYGFSNQPEASSRKDGLKLHNCRITNAVKCLPPQNKPIGSEINNCNSFLHDELESMPKNSLVISLGSIAHQAIIKALGLRQKVVSFAHGKEHEISDQLLLIDSYHCSRYNTQTRRLTTAMFQQIFSRAREYLNCR